MLCFYSRNLIAVFDVGLLVPVPNYGAPDVLSQGGGGGERLGT